MDPIRHVIARASKRLILAGWLRCAVVTLTVVIGLAVLARGVQKIAPLFSIEWTWVLPAGLALAVLTALAWAWARRAREAEIARILDERSGLRESLSTALCVEEQGGAWSRAVVEDANAKARRVVLRDAAPIAAPGNSWWPVAACAALLAVWWLPVRDLTGMLARKEAAQAERREVLEVAAAVDDTRKRIDEILSQAGVEVQDEGAEEDLFNPTELEQISPEEMQRAAIKELTELSDTLENKRNGEEGMTFDAIKDAMKRLESPEPGPATEMSRAMARGDFAEAKKQLEKIAEQVRSGEMSEEQKKQLEKQMEKMSEALGQMAQNRQQLEQQLKAAGLSEQQAQRLATDPNALEQALKEQGLAQEQIDALKQQAQAQQKAGDAASAMSQAMGQMAQGMQSGSEPQMGQGLEAMSGQLSNMEKMQSEMQSLEAAMGECSGQMASLCENPGTGQASGQGSHWGPNGQFMRGETMSQGSGSGGPGKGMGAGPDEQATDFVLKNEKATVNTTGQGPVIASTLVYGSQVRGESTASFSAAVTSAQARAAEAIETKRVPREHEQAVKAYFGRLRDAANAESGATKTGDAPAQQGEDAGN